MNEEFWNAIDKLVAESEIVIDRPTGSSHPRYPHIVYEVAYGTRHSAIAIFTLYLVEI